MVRDPDLRFTSGGRAVANFSFAVNKKVKNGDNWEEKTTFIDASCWASLAENVAASCPKGTRVIVTGEFGMTPDWEDDQGEKRKGKLVLNADEVGPALRFATVIVNKNPRKDER